MSSAHTITTPQSIALAPSTTVGYFGSVHNQELRRYKSVLLDESAKSKRSVEKEPAECEPFTLGDEAGRTFYSPGYPGHYTKNISCVRVLEGERECLNVHYLHRLSSPVSSDEMKLKCGEEIAISKIILPFLNFLSCDK